MNLTRSSAVVSVRGLACAQRIFAERFTAKDWPIVYGVLRVLCPSDLMGIRYFKKISMFLEIRFLEFFTQLQVVKKNNILNDTNTRDRKPFFFHKNNVYL